MADLAPVAASVIASSGATRVPGTLGATLVAGDVVYKDTTASDKLKAADSNSGSAGAAIRSPLGILLSGGADGQPTNVHTKGQLNLGITLTVGEIYCLSATAGKICPKGDLATGMAVVILGIAKTAALLDVNIVDSQAVVP